MSIKKKSIVINQRSNWSPRLYCKYAVTNNPAKVIGIRPNTIPNRKTSIISICLKEKKEYLYLNINTNWYESQWPAIDNWDNKLLSNKQNMT